MEFLDVIISIFGQSEYLGKMLSADMQAEITKFGLICTFMMMMIRREMKKHVKEQFAHQNVAITSVKEHFVALEKSMQAIVGQLTDFKGIFRTQNKRMNELEGSHEVIKYRFEELERMFKENKNE